MAFNSTLTIFSIFFIFMSLIKLDSQLRLEQFFQGQKVVKIPSFEARKKNLKQEDQELIELWESFLTGRSAPVSKWIKEDYKNLGLNHVFSPSGFHLSAILVPLTLLIPFRKFQICFLLLLSGLSLFIPGQLALKRMIHLKIGQHLFNVKIGFMIAMLIDILAGTISQSPLSFGFSYLFLSLIIFKKKGLNRHFFFSQMLIFYFSSSLISPLLLIISPILNFILTLLFPLLCVLALPLGDWSFEWGMILMRFLQTCVYIASKITSSFPLWEINLGVILISYFFYRSQKIMIFSSLLFLSQTLDTAEKSKIKLSSFDFIPNGNIIKTIQRKNITSIYYQDGICRRELINGLWWEKCSPKKRSTKRGKRIKKLSFP